MPPKKRARGNSWVDDETECLLSIWEELHVQAQLDSPTKADSAVYNRISKEMKEKGFEKSAVQCKERMKYLRKSYRQCRDKLKRSGHARKLCKFYAKLNQIFETRPATSPGKVLQSLANQLEVADRDISDSESLGVEPFQNDEDLALQIDDELDESVDQGNKDENETNVRKDPINDRNEEKKQQKPEKAKQRKSRVETSLELVMDKFTKSNEAIESKQLDIEKKRIDLELKKLEDEANKREYEIKKMEREEKQRSADRDHQLRMMEMIINSRQLPQAHNSGQLRSYDSVFPNTTSPEGRRVPADDANLQDNIYPSTSQRRPRGSVSRDQDGSTYYNM